MVIIRSRTVTISSKGTGVLRILQWRGSRGGRARPLGLGNGSPPVGSRGKAWVGSLGDEVPQKLKQNVKLAYNF